MSAFSNRIARAVARVVAAGLAVVPIGSGASAAPQFIGAERCGTCHAAEYQQWRASGHAVALGRLSRVQQRDATCRGCHTMTPTDENPALAGVQCESCHGAGGLYAPRYVMKDKELSKLLGLAPVTEDQCASCHSKDTPSVRAFSFEEKIALVRHGTAPAAKVHAP